jgi:cobaltochelatase CobN
MRSCTWASTATSNGCRARRWRFGHLLARIALGPMPHLYPFIVNDPGEGTQAKRRAQAVIVDHLTPPLTRAETYGPLARPRGAGGRILRGRKAWTRAAPAICAARSCQPECGHRAGRGRGLDRRYGGRPERLDAYLCDLKEAQIRDGLHVFGQSPEGTLARDLAIALARVPRGDGTGPDASLLRALADDLGLGFDPLSARPRRGMVRPAARLCSTSPDPWRSTGDTVERLELLSIRLVDALCASESALRDGGWGGAGLAPPASPPGPMSKAVLDHIADQILPTIAACGPAEGAALLTALDGRAIAPGPVGRADAGAARHPAHGAQLLQRRQPGRAHPHRLGAGLEIGQPADRKASAGSRRLAPRLLVTAWGTANMRTGGDDIAQALALMGVKPKWDSANRRVTGFEVLPLGVLGRPRVDVTLRISGFFRDAFPQLVALVDSAARAVQALDEAPDDNPAAAAGAGGRGDGPGLRVQTRGLRGRPSGADRRAALVQPRRSGRSLSGVGRLRLWRRAKRASATGWALNNGSVRSRPSCRIRTTANTTCSTATTITSSKAGPPPPSMPCRGATGRSITTTIPGPNGR